MSTPATAERALSDSIDRLRSQSQTERMTRELDDDAEQVTHRIARQLALMGHALTDDETRALFLRVRVELGAQLLKIATALNLEWADLIRIRAIGVKTL